MSTSDYLTARENAKTSSFTKFLWWCAGADSYFLQKSPKQDRVKYAGIGGIARYGYAGDGIRMVRIFTAFGQKSMAGQVEETHTTLFLVGNAVFAIAWGLMIFNLDRFIVSRIVKVMELIKSHGVNLNKPSQG